MVSAFSLFTVGTNGNVEELFRVDDGVPSTGGTSTGGTISLNAPRSGANAYLFTGGSAANVNLVLAPKGSGTLAFNTPSMTLQGSGTNALVSTPAGVNLVLSPGGTGLLQLPIPGTATTPASFTATKRLQFTDSTGTTWYVPANGTAW